MGVRKLAQLRCDDPRVSVVVDDLLPLSFSNFEDRALEVRISSSRKFPCSFFPRWGVPGGWFDGHVCDFAAEDFHVGLSFSFGFLMGFVIFVDMTTEQ